MAPMKQLGLGLNLATKKTRKREFLDEMERVVPWAALVQIVEPYYPKAKTGRPPFGIKTMLRVHYLQQWFALSDPAMEGGAARHASVTRVRQALRQHNPA
jgi:IS5 family transposase